MREEDIDDSICSGLLRLNSDFSIIFILHTDYNKLWQSGGKRLPFDRKSIDYRPHQVVNACGRDKQGPGCHSNQLTPPPHPFRKRITYLAPEGIWDHDHLYKDVCLLTGKPRPIQDSKIGFLMGNFQPYDRLVEKHLVTQLIIPASSPTLCHCYLAKPEELSIVVLCFPYLRILSHFIG